MEAGSGGKTIRVAVVDDHQMFVESLIRLLEVESDLEVVAVGSSALQALRTWDDLRPDVVILDYYLPDGNGADAISGLPSGAFRPTFIMLSGDTSLTSARHAASAGCAAVLTKDRAGRELIELVRGAHAGTLAPLTAAMDPPQPAGPGGETNGAPGSTARLSRREAEVLRMLADGAGTQHIAEALFISRNTVRAHVQRVITKLGTHSKLEAVAVARRAGLL